MMRLSRGAVTSSARGSSSFVMAGHIVLSGGSELAHELEAKGYEGLRKELGIEEEPSSK